MQTGWVTRGGLGAAPDRPAGAEPEAPGPLPEAEPDANATWLTRATRQIAIYTALMKPRIISLLLVTTLGAMILAEGGFPPLPLVLLTMLGGILASGGANAINQYVDRDIDELMRRTRSRPLPSHRVPPERALIFGVSLGILAFVVLAVFVNLLSAFLAITGLLFYVVVYTLWLKRSTPQNIVIGGAAGAIPPLVGWAAVTGTLDLTALFLFAIIFFWTPPHFWALSLLLKLDYAAARIPMLPVISGEAETKRQIILYSLLLVAVSLLPFASRLMGFWYLGAALLLGAGLLAYAVQLARGVEHIWARRLFFYTNGYLLLLFVAMIVDNVIMR